MYKWIFGNSSEKLKSLGGLGECLHATQEVLDNKIRTVAYRCILSLFSSNQIHF